MTMTGSNSIASSRADLIQEKGEEHGLGRKAVVTLVVGYLEAILLGGCFTGWNMLVYTLKQDGVFESACNLDNSTMLATSNLPETTVREVIDCDARDKQLSLAYTIAMFLNGSSAFPSGWLFDRFGLRVTHIMGTILLIVGFFMLGYAGGELSWLIYPGISCLSIGNIALMIPLNHINNLLRNKASTGVALYNGAFTASGMVFFVEKVAAEKGFPRAYFMFIMMGLSGAALVSTFVLLPAYKVSAVTGLPITRADFLKAKSAAEVEKVVVAGSTTEGTSSVKCNGFEEVSFWSSLTSVLYLTHLYWFGMSHLRVHYFVGSFNAVVTSITGGDVDKVSFLSDVYGFSIMLPLVVAPLVGIFMDSRRRYLTEAAVFGRQRSIAAIIPITLGVCLVLGLSSFALVPEEWAVYVSIACVQSGRGFIYATCAAYIQIAFPASHFGKLFGLSHATGGLLNLTQYGYFSWAAAVDDFFPSNLLLLCLVALTCVHPITIVVYHRIQRKKNVSRVMEPVELTHL